MKNKITVINLENPKYSKIKNYELIDRKTILGNPFKKDGKNTKDERCDSYQKYFNDKVFIEKDENFLKELERLHKLSLKGDLYLACHCKPKRCHGDTIKRFLDSYRKNAKKVKGLCL
jgi:hypothetical protein